LLTKADESFRISVGRGPHRYVITVHSLDVEHIGISVDGTPAMLAFTMSSHILGRAILTGTAEMPAR
jgi:phosphatidylethanolamine-binding protein (PEBP) family uncharacterized protein